jgi:outer membrane protein TolC
MIRLFEIFLGLLSLGSLSLHAFELSDDCRPEYFFNDLANALSEFDTLSPSLKNEEFDVEIASAEQTIAKADQGVRFGVNLYAQSIHEDRPKESFYHRYRLVNQVYLKKPLYHWGALKAQEEIASLNKKWTQDNLAFQTRLLSGELRAVFLELVILNFRTELAQEQLVLASEVSSANQQRLKLGLVTPLSLDEAKTEELSKEISLSELKSLLQRKRADFTSLCGSESELNLAISDEFWEYCNSYDHNMSFPKLVGFLNSESLSRLRTQVKIEDQKVIAAEAELKPKLNLTSSFFQDQIDVADRGKNLDRNNFVVGIEANWALWDSHKSAATKKASLARKTRVEHLIENQIRELRKDFNSMVSELSSLKERMRLARKLILLAQSRFEKSKIELKLNRISDTDHFSVKVDLDQAKLNLLQVSCDFMILLDQFDQLVNDGA